MDGNGVIGVRLSTNVKGFEKEVPSGPLEAWALANREFARLFSRLLMCC
jgi:hypothetical protein